MVAVYSVLMYDEVACLLAYYLVFVIEDSYFAT